MGLMDFLTSALENGAAARGGYLEGQENQELRNNAMRRQAMLDQMAQAKNTAEIGELQGRAKWYNTGGAGAYRIHVVKTPNGVMVLDGTGRPIRQATPDDIAQYGIEPGSAVSASGGDTDLEGGPGDSLMGQARGAMPGFTQSNGINVDTSGLPQVGVSVPGAPGQQGPTTSTAGGSPYIIPGSEPPTKTPAMQRHTPTTFTLNGKQVRGSMDAAGNYYDGQNKPIPPGANIGPAYNPNSGRGGGGAAGGGLSAGEQRAQKSAYDTVMGAVTNTQGDTTAARANLNKTPMNPSVGAIVQNNPSLMGQVLDAYTAGKTKASDAHTRTKYSTPGMMAGQDSISKAMQGEISAADTQLQSILGNPAAPDAIKQQARAAHDARVNSIRQRYAGAAPGGGGAPPDDDEDEQDIYSNSSQGTGGY